MVPTHPFVLAFQKDVLKKLAFIEINSTWAEDIQDIEP